MTKVDAIQAIWFVVRVAILLVAIAYFPACGWLFWMAHRWRSEGKATGSRDDLEAANGLRTFAAIATVFGLVIAFIYWFANLPDGPGAR